MQLRLVCISRPPSHMVRSRWGDAWLLMIESSSANRCYHLCKPSHSSAPQKVQKMNKCKNDLITKRRAARHPRTEWALKVGTDVGIRGGGGFLDLCGHTLAISTSAGTYRNNLKTWNVCLHEGQQAGKQQCPAKRPEITMMTVSLKCLHSELLQKLAAYRHLLPV